MDIAVRWNPNEFRCEWSLVAGDLATGFDIETAVLVALFTDALATPDYVPNDGTNDRRGWWGDALEDAPLGSNLWQLNRSKIGDTAALLARAQDYCRACLQRLIADGVAESVAVSCAIVGQDLLGIAIVVTQPGHPSVSFDYQYAWVR